MRLKVGALLVMLLAQVVPVEADGANVPNNTPFLQAGVTVNQEIKPVEPTLRPGVTYNQASLPPLGTQEMWIWIPAWRAGRFHRDAETDVLPGGAFTHESRTDHLYGFQLDRNGGIWHYIKWPQQEVVVRGNITESKLIRTYQVITVSPSVYEIRATETNVDIASDTKMIVRTTQQWDQQRYFPGSYGVASAVTSKQMFDLNARPTTPVVNGNLSEFRTAPFQRIDFFEGKDMRLSFRNYLISRNMANLLPDDLR